MTKRRRTHATAISEHLLRLNTWASVVQEDRSVLDVECGIILAAACASGTLGERTNVVAALVCLDKLSVELAVARRDNLELEALGGRRDREGSASGGEGSGDEFELHVGGWDESLQGRGRKIVCVVSSAWL